MGSHIGVPSHSISTSLSTLLTQSWGTEGRLVADTSGSVPGVHRTLAVACSLRGGAAYPVGSCLCSSFEAGATSRASVVFLRSDACVGAVREETYLFSSHARGDASLSLCTAACLGVFLSTRDAGAVREETSLLPSRARGDASLTLAGGNAFGIPFAALTTALTVSVTDASDVFVRSGVSTRIGDFVVMISWGHSLTRLWRS